MSNISKVLIVLISFLNSLYANENLILTEHGIETSKGVIVSDNIKLGEAMTYDYSIRVIDNIGLSVIYESYGQSKKQCYIPIYIEKFNYYLKDAICFEIITTEDKQGDIKPNWLGYRVHSKYADIKSADIDAIINSKKVKQKTIGYLKNNKYVFDNLEMISNQNKILNSAHVFKDTILSNGFVYIDLGMLQFNKKTLTPQSIEIKLKNKENSRFCTISLLQSALSEYKLSERSLTSYNNIAYYLEKAKAYNEASFLLEKILEEFPNRTVAYLNLGDAYWGLGDTGKAKAAYQTYIKQMKESDKEKKIPKVVLERVK